MSSTATAPSPPTSTTPASVEAQDLLAPARDGGRDPAVEFELGPIHERRTALAGGKGDRGSACRRDREHPGDLEADLPNSIVLMIMLHILNDYVTQMRGRGELERMVVRFQRIYTAYHQLADESGLTFVPGTAAYVLNRNARTLGNQPILAEAPPIPIPEGYFPSSTVPDDFIMRTPPLELWMYRRPDGCRALDRPRRHLVDEANIALRVFSPRSAATSSTGWPECHCAAVKSSARAAFERQVPNSQAIARVLTILTLRTAGCGHQDRRVGRSTHHRDGGWPSPLDCWNQGLHGMQPFHGCRLAAAVGCWYGVGCRVGGINGCVHGVRRVTMPPAFPPPAAPG